MSIALMVQAVVCHEDGFHDASLPHGYDREISHVQVDRHGHQARITLALHDLLRLDFSRLRDVQFR